ncbi:hypothetical protein [Streptococcus ruminantium]|uniref:hypothetical protein n=1 Tax=Streptococcus ruminantium TaxID=1917441 RepID=UPI0012DF6E1C|nr:hypothetical protein [Streptococcus ruminantium]
MKTILRYFWYKEKYNLYRSINGFFYYLRRLPLLGKKIPATIFKAYDFKSGLFFVLHFLTIPSRLFVKGIWLAIYFGIATFVVNLLQKHSAPLHHQETVWLLGFTSWMIFVGYGYRFSKGFEPFIAKADREFMQNFDLSHSSFLQSQLFVEPILTSLYYLPALLVYCFSTGEWIYFPVGLLTIPAGHFAGHAANRLLFNRRILVRQNSWQSWGIMISAFLILGLLFFFKNQLSSKFLLLALACQPFLIWAGYRYLKKQTNDLDYLQHCMDESLQMDKKIAELTKGNDYTRQGLQMQDKLSLDKGKDLSHLSGMTYLNALLFDRYHSILFKKLRFRLVLLLAILLSLEAIIWFFKADFKIANTDYIAALPFAFMIMYVASMGKAVAQMVFVNCDISMLHYPFYREPKTIIAGFNYRFTQTAKWNACFSGSLLLSLLILTRASLPLSSYLLTALLLTSLTALFSFHDLFIYYILQPFTKDMEVVNPVYRFLSGALYWIAYLNTKLRISSQTYILLVSLGMIAYVAIGYWLLLKKAPKTFRLKA